jgi:hypothetical protein
MRSFREMRRIDTASQDQIASGSADVLPVDNTAIGENVS